MSDFLQHILYYSDFLFIGLLTTSCLFAIKRVNKSVVLISTLLIIATALRHIAVSDMSLLEPLKKIEQWYATFFGLYILVLLISVAVHFLLLFKIDVVIKLVHGLLLINTIAYGFMHYQRAVFHIHTPNISWDVYTWTVISGNYLIAGLLIFASLGSRPWIHKQKSL